MARFVVGCGLLFLTALQIGCSNSCTPKCSGCGELYLGAYVDDPPRCEPCDRCANYTGCGCDPCADRMPWNRVRGRWFHALNDYAKRRDAQCCDGDCGGGGECCDESCGAAGCGDAGCGCTSSGGQVMYEETGMPLSSRTAPSNMRNVSHSRVVETAGSRSPQPCNCGRH